ncbi:uracil-DNA glycosylase family protein [Streptococcus cameli]
MDKLKAAIKLDEANAVYTQVGIEPLFQAPASARILLIGQAPGLLAQEKGQLFQDRSGDRLRDWLGVDEETFYDSGLFAILPMDFYFPGSGKSGDLPPRKGFAQKWHPQLLAQMPAIELTILIGQYAQAHYLGDQRKENLTATVRDAKDYLPTYFPLVHPSPRNQIWLAKNPWFQTETVPLLKEHISHILSYKN